MDEIIKKGIKKRSKLKIRVPKKEITIPVNEDIAALLLDSHHLPGNQFSNRR